MTASELLNNTLKMLGYSEANGNIELPQRILNRAVVAVNLVYEDLWGICNTEPFESIKSLADEIKLPEKVLNSTFLYGLAMHIAAAENDGDQNQIYAHLYNSKRAALTRFEKIRNTLPRSFDA